MTTIAKGSASKRNWGLFFGGLLVIVAGFIVMFWPGLTMITIAEIAGVFLIVAGIADFAGYSQAKQIGMASGWAIVSGICNIILGILFIAHPVFTASVIPFIVGWFVLAYGIFAIVTGIGIKSVTPVWGVMTVNGVISVLCGLMFILLPDTFVIFLGVFLWMRGITMCTFGILPSSNMPY